jgi:thiol-disulfide isomerase/thioredoxin
VKIFKKIFYNSYFYTKRLGLGLYFFGIPNTLYNNLFNKLHLKFIANKETDNEDIRQFLKKGFFKTKINSSSLCEYISTEIKKQSVNPLNYGHSFEINEQMKIQIKTHINYKYAPILKQLEKFYNSKISVASIHIRRNFSIDESVNKEVYSNNYHADSFTYNLFKMFINLMDVSIEQGPLHIYSKLDTKKFIKLNNYKNRNNYFNKELENNVVRNTGNMGESFIANTTECLHKAGVVKKGNYRDILFISFISAPEKINIDKDDFFYYEEKYPKAIWGDTEEVVNITKPQSLKKTIKLFFKYYKNKSI